MKIKIQDANTHLNYASGYGQISAAIASGLSGMGHDVYYEYLTGSSDPVLDKLARKVFVHSDDTIYLWIRPPHYAKDPKFNPAYKNVFYTMHESSSFEGWKSDWPQLLNKVKLVITPTQWNKKVFVDNGVTVPIEVVPVGILRKVFFPQDSRTFNILTVHDAFGSKNSRENWQMTMDAFDGLFKTRQAILTVKSWNTKTPVPAGDKVVLIDSTLFPQDMVNLYRSHQVFIKNSNREGWSIPMTEAMACGMVVIAYDNPVLRENAGSYPLVTWFKTKEQLMFRLDAAYKSWRTFIEQVDQFGWQNSLKKIEKILLTV